MCAERKKYIDVSGRGGSATEEIVWFLNTLALEKAPRLNNEGPYSDQQVSHPSHQFASLADFLGSLAREYCNNPRDEGLSSQRSLSLVSGDNTTLSYLLLCITFEWLL